MSQTLRFIIVPKVANHPWFNEIHTGAQAQANLLSKELGIDIIVESIAPAICDVIEQNAILDQILELKPTGVAIDPVDAINHMTAINHIREKGIPVVLFDSPSEDHSITSIGNNFEEQGKIAAERLVKLIGYSGKVAVMQGFPLAPNHKARYEAQLTVLSHYPEICIVNGGIDNDDIETAYQQCCATLESHPDLRGYLCCDASGPIGIAKALKQAGKIGEVTVVSMDGIKPILDAIKEGVIESSSATKPRMQGSMSILMLWQASLGIPIPQSIDTGIDLITKDNVDLYLSDIS
jgi:ribose transport system substrate-binding protein